jgi:energy-converting hydrogenase A subunit M
VDLTKALEILVKDHIEEQMKHPQMLTLSETVGMLGGCRCGELHEGMLPEDVAKCIMADMADMGKLEEAKIYFQKLDEDGLLEETSLYEVMADLGEVDWH